MKARLERLPELAAELVRLNCDVIFTIGNEAAGAAKNATKEIPDCHGQVPAMLLEAGSSRV